MEPRDRLWTPQKGKAEVYVLYQRCGACVKESQAFRMCQTALNGNCMGCQQRCSSVNRYHSAWETRTSAGTGTPFNNLCHTPR